MEQSLKENGLAYIIRRGEVGDAAKYNSRDVVDLLKEGVQNKDDKNKTSETFIPRKIHRNIKCLLFNFCYNPVVTFFD